VSALDHVQWSEPRQFRGALATTLAKSQRNRRVFDLVFDRFFFQATESPLSRGVHEEVGNRTRKADASMRRAAPAPSPSDCGLRRL